MYCQMWQRCILEIISTMIPCRRWLGGLKIEDGEIGGEFLVENFKLGFRVGWSCAFLEREKLHTLCFCFWGICFLLGGWQKKDNGKRSIGFCLVQILIGYTYVFNSPQEYLAVWTWRRMATKNENKNDPFSGSMFVFVKSTSLQNPSWQMFLGLEFGPTQVWNMQWKKTFTHIKWWIGWRWEVCCKKTVFCWVVWQKKRLYLCVFLEGFWGICPADDLDILMRRLGMFFGRFTTKKPLKTPEANVFSLLCFFRIVIGP